MAKDLTQQEKIIATMIAFYPNKIWFFAPDFIQPQSNEFFVGYEASARLSELAKEYPDLIETRRRGKFSDRRLRFENMQIIKKAADLGLQMFIFFLSELEKRNINYQDFIPKPQVIFSPDSTANVNQSSLFGISTEKHENSSEL